MEQFANAAQSTLNGSITDSATTLVVGSNSTFPASGNFRILIDSELMIVTGVSSTTFTVTRGAEGSTAASHSSGATVYGILTAGALQNIVSVQVAGVDTSDRQILNFVSGASVSDNPTDSRADITIASVGTISNDQVFSNISGSTATPTGNTLTAVIDACIGNTQGDILYRGSSTWSVLCQARPATSFSLAALRLTQVGLHQMRLAFLSDTELRPTFPVLRSQGRYTYRAMALCLLFITAPPGLDSILTVRHLFCRRRSAEVIGLRLILAACPLRIRLAAASS